MGTAPWYVELKCPQCRGARVLGEADVVRTLQQLGMLRRTREAEPDILMQLLTSAAGRMTCPDCAAVGLAASEADDADINWGDARTCAQCGGVIARERLEALPDTTLCAACQGRDEKGASPETPEYCAHCGAIMQLRQVAGRVTRYALKCPECGR